MNLSTVAIVGIPLLTIAVSVLIFAVVLPNWRRLERQWKLKEKIGTLYDWGVLSESKTAVLTYQNMTRRPKNVDGGTYYPTHSIVHITPDWRVRTRLVNMAGNIDNVQLHLLPEEAVLKMSSYQFGFRAPAVDRPLTIDEVLAVI